MNLMFMTALGALTSSLIATAATTTVRLGDLHQGISGAFHPIVALDLDGDGSDEIVSVQPAADGVLLVTSLNDDGRVEVVQRLPLPDVTLSPYADVVAGPLLGAANAERVDLVIADDDACLLLPGRDDGRLQPPIALPLTATFLESADLDGDGVPELVVVDAHAPGVTVYSIATGTPIRLGAIGTAPYASDIALVDGTGDGTFTPVLDAGGAVSSFTLELIDATDDGILDAVVVEALTNVVRVLPGDGTGRWLPSVLDLAVHDGVFDLEVDDFNGDGAIDLVIPARSDDTLSIWLSDSKAVWSATTFADCAGCQSIARADFDGNGLDDIIVTQTERADELVHIVATAPAEFTRAGPVRTGTNAPSRFIAAGDWNGVRSRWHDRRARSRRSHR